MVSTSDTDIPKGSVNSLWLHLTPPRQISTLRVYGPDASRSERVGWSKGRHPVACPTHSFPATCVPYSQVLRHREDYEKLPYLQQNRGDCPFCDTIWPCSKLVLGN